MNSTLEIGNVPKSVDFAELRVLCNKVGCQQVFRNQKVKSSKNSFIAKFRNEHDATYALHHMHQLKVHGRRLIVRFFEDELPDETGSCQARTSAYNQEEIQARLNVVSISSNLGIQYPFNPKLLYLYPPPNPDILLNIVEALTTSPQFYNQSVHLMNKMSLKPPFRTNENPPEVLKKFGHHLVSLTPVQPAIAAKPLLVEEEESEISSEEDDLLQRKIAQENIVPAFLAKPKSKPALKGTLKVAPVAAKSRNKDRDSAEIFEGTQVEKKRKLEIKPIDSLNMMEKQRTVPEMVAPATTVGEASKAQEGFGVLPSAKVVGDRSEAAVKASENEITNFISKKELDQSRVKGSDFEILPVFKGWEPGEPNSRLYVKNLSKQTSARDLRFIFGRYVVWTAEEESNMFDIRLMQEGRMKGQAFVTLPNAKRAKEALKDTHGYILHGKPMVVQFARAAKPKDT